MPVHYAVWGVGALVAKAGALVAKGAAVAHHAIAAHAAAAAAAAAAAGGRTVVTAAYLDHAQLMRWYSENEPGLKVDRSVKFAIAGKLVSGEFTTVSQSQPLDTVMQGFMHPGTHDVLKSRAVKARRLDPALAAALAGGQMVVYN